MGYYYSKCPYCGRKIEASYAKPLKKLGKPQKMCIRCGNIYLDSNIIDWDNVSLFKKFLFCLANGRFFLCLFPCLIINARMEWGSPWFGLLASLVAFAICVLYVQIKVWIYRGGR